MQGHENFILETMCGVILENNWCFPCLEGEMNCILNFFIVAKNEMLLLQFRWMGCILLEKIGTFFFLTFRFEIFWVMRRCHCHCPSSWACVEAVYERNCCSVSKHKHEGLGC